MLLGRKIQNQGKNMKLSEYIEETGKLKNLNLDGEYECDKCKASFKAGEVLLVKELKNLSILPSPMLMGMGGLLTVEYNGDSYHLQCPLCNYTHLFGFNKKGSSKK